MVKKRLLPSKRERRRYLAFEIVSKSSGINSFKAIANANLIKAGSLKGLKLLSEKWNSKLQRGIIRINNKYVNDLRSALDSINKINDKEVKIKSVGISGILNKAERKYLIKI